jgi:hypothetical protein
MRIKFREAGVGVRAALLHRQSAVAVGQGLRGAAEALFGPGGLGDLPGRVENDCGAMDVDLASRLPLAPHGGVVQAGVVAGHLRGVVLDMRVICGGSIILAWVG